MEKYGKAKRVAHNCKIMRRKYVFCMPDDKGDDAGINKQEYVRRVYFMRPNITLDVHCLSYYIRSSIIDLHIKYGTGLKYN